MMLTEFGEQLLVAEWHTSGGLNIPTVGQRTSFYGVSGVPHVRIDGKYSVIGASSCTGAAANYRNMINTRLSETGGLSPVDITAVHSVSATGVWVSATFTLVDPVTLVSPSAYLMVLEDDVLHLGTVYDHIVRAEYHEPVILTNPGDHVTVETTFPIQGWNVDNIQCVVFLQKMTGDKEMYNARKAPMVSDFRFAWEASIISIPARNGTAAFEGTLTNISDGSDQLTLTLDNTFGWPAEFMVTGEAGYHTTPSTIALDPQEQVGIYLRVHTDNQLRIGEGQLAVFSAVSERTAYYPARVFNGSQAILFVDDDNGVHPTEQPFITALNNGGYLFDRWDVRVEHGAMAPDFEVMQPYDIVLWATGYDYSDIITPANAGDLMAFMDQGKGVILSSADFLNGFTAGNTFLTDYLGIATFQTNVGATQATGVGGDPISGGMSLTLEYPHSSYNRADRITASPIGTINFHNQSSYPIGVRADNGTARAVTFTFAATAVVAGAHPNNLTTLIDRSIDWIWEAQSQGVAEPGGPVRASRISSVRPNPVGPASGGGAATFQLTLTNRAAAAPVRVDVLDLNGRLVRNVCEAPLPAGTSSVSWDGRDALGHPVSAGIYYARLATSEGESSRRVVVVR